MSIQNTRIIGPVYLALSVAAVVISFLWSDQLRWLGDDIFIALRYVQNFLNGDGLVYNPGEYVEGYTDFLWVMLISLCARLGFDPLSSTQVMGMFFSIATIIIASLICIRIATRSKRFILPYVPLALALNIDFNTWATGGLETSFYTFLLLCSFFFYWMTSLRLVPRLVFSGLFLTLAMLTRPEAVLLHIASSFLILGDHFLSGTRPATAFKELLLFNTAALLIYLPYFCWRYNYYGFLFPNTYYAKLGYETDYVRGFYYLWSYFKVHFTAFLPFIILPALLMFRKRRDLLNPLKPALTLKFRGMFLGIFLLTSCYLIFFVARVGGDFMYARFIVPAAPFIAILLFISVVEFSPEPRVNIILTLLVLSIPVENHLRANIMQSAERKHGFIKGSDDIADERYVYTQYLPISHEIILGKILHKAFEDVPARMLVKGGQACMAYFAEFPYAQEYHGLTDTLIAHSKVVERGRIGHEKRASPEYLEEKGIQFLFNRSPVSHRKYRYATLTFRPYVIRVEIISFNSQVMDKLKLLHGNAFAFVDFREYLDKYIAGKLPQASTEELKNDYEEFRRYYFMHNHDPERENKFLEKLK